MATALQVRPLMAEEPRSNNLAWRVSVLERQVQSLLDGKPEVVSERVATLSSRVNDLRAEMKEDMSDMRSEVRALKRIFLSVFSGVGVAVVAAIIALFITGGNP